jgi:hypothetical protein
LNQALSARIGMPIAWLRQFSRLPILNNWQRHFNQDKYGDRGNQLNRVRGRANQLATL